MDVRNGIDIGAKGELADSHSKQYGEDRPFDAHFTG
jgi:hypothetical protein